MSQDFSFFFIPLLTDHNSSYILSFKLMLCLVAFLVVFSFWLYPGGLAWAIYKHQTKPKSSSAIPGPSGLPIFGLLFAFNGCLTHRVLETLSKTLKTPYLMAFSVGFTRFVISSNLESAKEMLNSSAFADRPVKESAYELLFHRAMGFAPYGEYWRKLRRISATHLFSPKRIACFGETRQLIGTKMVQELAFYMEKNGFVEVKKILHVGSLNNVMMSVFGKCYTGTDTEFEHRNEDGEVEGLVSEGYELLGIFNWSDHFPLLAWLDLQGVRKRCRELVHKVNVFVGKIIEDHRFNRAKSGVCSDDFVDVLLDLEKENRLCDSDMIAVLWEMIFRGTDTVAILLEWILARMVLHPEIQAKAQAEIDSVTGSNRAVCDADLPNLPYLLAIIKETLRMHPPGPLLSWARLAIHDTHVGPHFIPAGTTAMVNMWAITHNDKYWPKPEDFKPERFMEEEQDFSIMGSDLRLAPFGSGRRVCPGKAVGLATVHLWFAQLLQKLQWLPCDNNNVVDLSECLKLSMEMKHPLACKVIPRGGES